MAAIDTKLQNLLDRTLARRKTHGVLLRVQSGDGRIDFRGSTGNATPDIRFPIASISKTYTTALILQLIDEGRLFFEQTVQDALPEVDLSRVHVVKGVDHGADLTIRQLLFQTSGLADYYEGGVAEHLLRGKDNAYGLAQVLDWARSGKPQAAPDTGKAHYSDTNLQLLGNTPAVSC